MANDKCIQIPFRRGLAVGALVLLTSLAFFAIRLIWIQHSLRGSSAAFYSTPTYQTDLLLANFPIYKQKYANSCGPTTISMIYSFLIEPITEQELANKLGYPLGKSGMLPMQFSDKLQSALGEYGYHIEHDVNSSGIALLEQIYLQLEHGIPVPIYFSTINDWDKPNYDTHYSAIIGIRPKKQKVIIANAYGFLEEIPVNDLLNAMKYNNYRNAPIDFRLGLFLGIINKNNLFIIRK